MLAHRENNHGHNPLPILFMLLCHRDPSGASRVQTTYGLLGGKCSEWFQCIIRDEFTDPRLTRVDPLDKHVGYKDKMIDEPFGGFSHGSGVSIGSGSGIDPNCSHY